MGAGTGVGTPIGHGIDIEFSPDTQIRMYPKGMDKEELELLRTTGELKVGNIHPKIKRKGFIHRKYFLLYNPPKNMNERESRLFLKKIEDQLSHVCEICGVPSLSYDVLGRGYWMGGTRIIIRDKNNQSYHS